MASKPVKGAYIGDGVYAEFDGYGIWLRTPRESGVHEIYLEDEVWRALLAFGERIRDRSVEAMNGGSNV